MSKNVPNSVQTCYEVIFSEIIMPAGSKNGKKWKKKLEFWNFKSEQKRS